MDFVYSSVFLLRSKIFVVFCSFRNKLGKTHTMHVWFTNPICHTVRGIKSPEKNSPQKSSPVKKRLPGKKVPEKEKEYQENLPRKVEQFCYFYRLIPSHDPTRTHTKRCSTLTPRSHIHQIVENARDVHGCDRT